MPVIISMSGPCVYFKSKTCIGFRVSAQVILVKDFLMTESTK